jgi:hypothetical protein
MAPVVSSVQSRTAITLILLGLTYLGAVWDLADRVHPAISRWCGSRDEALGWPCL